MKNILLLFIIFFNTFLINSQTSLSTELTRDIYNYDFYILRNKKAKKIDVESINNPNDKNNFTQNWKFKIKQKIIFSSYFKNGVLQSKSYIKIDSLNRKINTNVKTKHKFIGWVTEKTKIIYGHNFKEIQVIDDNSNIKLRMLVQYNEQKLPESISSFNENNLLISKSTADYNYKEGQYIYKVINSNGKIVLENNSNYNNNYLISENEFGDITKMFWPTSKKSSNVIHEIEYTYDKYNNWIKKKVVLISPSKKQILRILKRKIKY